MSKRSRLPPQRAWDLADHVGHAYTLLADIMRRTLPPGGPSVAEVVALAVLGGHQAGLTQTAWGDLQGVTRQRAHTITREFERRGLVRVTRQGRTSLVRLSPAGRALLERHRREIGETYAAALEGVSVAEARRLEAALLALIARLEHASTTIVPAIAVRP